MKRLNFTINTFWLLSLFISISLQFDCLQEKLKDWSIIENDDVVQSDFYHHRGKRGLGNRGGYMKKVSMNLFDEKVHMSLYPYDLFSPNLKIEIHGKNGSEFLKIDQNLFMEGIITDKPKSTVVAHFNNGTVIANIIDEDESYFVEPLWRHVENGGNGKLLVYRLSDINSNNTEKRNFCGGSLYGNAFHQAPDINSKDHLKLNQPKHPQVKFHKRNKRKAVAKNICELKISVDHRAYGVITKDNDYEMVYYVSHHIASVGKLFKATKWDKFDDRKGGVFTGFHFQIAWIEMFREPTTKPRYNYVDSLPSRAVLQAYSETPHEFCLAHLITYREFEDGLLGLAYVAEPGQQHGLGGGICAYYKGRSPSYNAGMTTLNSHGKILLSAEAILVTTHELGHNFGSFHDDEMEGASSECAPSSRNGGDYVMSPSAVVGNYPNNFKFSPCSKRNVYKVIESESPFECFVQREEEFCGDYKLKPSKEECDAGYRNIGLKKADKCCTEDCKLTRNSVCSPINYACCDNNCQIASKLKMCRNRIPGLCYEQAFCDGINLECPPITNVADGTECGNEGKCRNGTCVSFCAGHGMQECFCESEKFQCVRCCAPLGQILNCSPFKKNDDDNMIRLANNSRCFHGYCKNDVCVKTMQDVIERVYGVLDDIGKHGLIAFCEDNLVAGITIISLLVWVPVACFFSFVDREAKRYKEEEQERFLDELDLKLPHYPIESEHGFDLRKIISQNEESKIKFSSLMSVREEKEMPPKMVFFEEDV